MESWKLAHQSIIFYLAKYIIVYRVSHLVDENLPPVDLGLGRYVSWWDWANLTALLPRQNGGMVDLSQQEVFTDKMRHPVNWGTIYTVRGHSQMTSVERGREVVAQILTQ